MIPSQFEPIAITAVVNTILALGLYVTIMSGQLSAGHAALAGIGAYAAAVFTTTFDLPFPLALLVGVAASTVAGLTIPLLTMRLSPLAQKLATLAFGETMAVVAFNTEFIGGANGFFGIPAYTSLPILVLAAAAVFYIVWRIEASPLGLAARAVRDDRIAASTSGVNIRRVRIAFFGIGAAIVGLAGGLSAHYTLVVNPVDLAFPASFLILGYVLVGGSYTIWGPVLGATVLTILPQLLRFTITYRFALVGLAIVAIILLRPQGLIGRWTFSPRTRPGPAVDNDNPGPPTGTES